MAATTYRTAILDGWNPDPSMIRVGDDYFLCTSSFEYFPGLPIYHSKDLIDWKLINHACSRRSQLEMRTVEAGGGIFAPTIREHKGRIYVTCCQMQKSDSEGGYKKIVAPRGFFLSTDNIFEYGSFAEPTWLHNAGIDQDLFFDDLTGKIWMSTADFITDPKTLSKKTGMPIVVVTRQIDSSGHNKTQDVVNLYSSVGNGVAEGPHIFRRGEYYYLSVAIGGTDACHQQWIHRSKEGPLGPWETAPSPINPMIFNDTHPEIRMTGHMDLCPGDGGVEGDAWWAVFLGLRPQWGHDGPKVFKHAEREAGFSQGGEEAEASQLGRETFLCPVEWKDGWPIVNRGEPVAINGLAGTGLKRSEERFEENYDYKPAKELPLGWYHARTPLTLDYNQFLRPGSLALYGGPYRFEDDECLSMHLRKQPTHIGEWTANVEFEPANITEEAGTTVWWSKHCYASLGIRGAGDEPEGEATGKALVFRFPDPTLPEEVRFKETSIPIKSNSANLKIVAESLQYTFFAQIDGSQEWQEVGSMESRAITRNRVFDSFCTGTMLGIYTLGAKNRPTLQPAFFDGLSWRGTRYGGF